MQKMSTVGIFGYASHTQWPALWCSEKHYRRLMLTGTALFKLHAQEKENVRRTTDNRSSDDWKVPVNSASVAPCYVRAAWLWFEQTNTLQPGSVCIHFGSALRNQIVLCLFVYCTRSKFSPSSVVSEIAQVGHRSSSQKHRPCKGHSLSTLAFPLGVVAKRQK